MPQSASIPVEDFREYLLPLGRLQLAPAITTKVDLSGVVQQTILKAGRASPPQGDKEARLAWLRKLLANDLRDEIRKLTAARRELRIEAALDASSARVHHWLTSRESSPSGKAIRAEELNRLVNALVASRTTNGTQSSCTTWWESPLRKSRDSWDAQRRRRQRFCTGDRRTRKQLGTAETAP